jgi:hypothetical protein
LKNGSIWMLGRTQTGYLFQSFSNDGGATWTKEKASIFHSSNSPANILKLPDERLVVTWCNTVDSDMTTFGKIYTHREVLHMAISDDDGRSWRGFREIMRNPTRNDQNDLPKGDSGVSYPNTSFTKEGKIILVTGQGEHGGGRAIWLVDPRWLYETKQEEDFSNGLEKWSAYTFSNLKQKPGRILGPELLTNISEKGNKVLHIRKDKQDLLGDDAIWNFPMGREGSIEMRIKIPKGSKGHTISLTDCHRHPNDPNGATKAMFSFAIDENSFDAIKPGNWHTVHLKWNMNIRNCELYIDNKFFRNLVQNNDSGMGISYIRFKSLAKEGQVDYGGVFLDWIKSDSKQPYSKMSY